MATGTAKNAFHNDYQRFDVDERVAYPSYKSFDRFIDVDRLVSLNDFLTDRITDDIEGEAASYFVNLHRLDEATPYAPGVREIWLTRTRADVPAAAYASMIDRAELWEPTNRAAEFAPLMDFVATLPFETTGRILIIYDNEGREVPAHRDHLVFDTCNEFVWLRTNKKKPFYMLNNDTGEKKYVESYSAWFDAVNQYHGCDGCDGLTFSIRVDGVFTKEFREKIPVPRLNPASTPALWASMEAHH
jgi:hypothetical protein